MEAAGGGITDGKLAGTWCGGRKGQGHKQLELEADAGEYPFPRSRMMKIWR